MLKIIEYHKSITHELVSISDRVSNLIKQSGEEGRYREAILRKVIRNFLPLQFEIATGFIVKGYRENEDHDATTQIDFIIYDTNFPVLFKEGDFVIITPEGVRGIIEVKTNIQNESVTETIKKANENGKFIYEFMKDLPLRRNFFNGIFSFRMKQDHIIDSIKRDIKEAFTDLNQNEHGREFFVDHISLDKDHFLKAWYKTLPEEEISIYKIVDMSFPYFISNLMFTIIEHSDNMAHDMWFPDKKQDKELFALNLRTMEFVEKNNL